MDPDGGSSSARPHLDQIAELVDQPQAASALLRRGTGPQPPSQRIGDVACVADLADRLRACRPGFRKRRGRPPGDMSRASCLSTSHSSSAGREGQAARCTHHVGRPGCSSAKRLIAEIRRPGLRPASPASTQVTRSSRPFSQARKPPRPSSGPTTIRTRRAPTRPGERYSASRLNVMVRHGRPDGHPALGDPLPSAVAVLEHRNCRAGA